MSFENTDMRLIQIAWSAQLQPQKRSEVCANCHSYLSFKKISKNFAVFQIDNITLEWSSAQLSLAHFHFLKPLLSFKGPITTVLIAQNVNNS